MSGADVIWGGPKLLPLHELTAAREVAMHSHKGGGAQPA